MTPSLLTNHVGSTPLIRINSLSNKTGLEIWAKAEFLNPGGSVKDRAAKGIIEDAEQSGKLMPGYTIYEGTAGNTGIGLTTLAAQRGYKCTIVMPDNQALEKYQTLEALGAKLIKVKPVPFSDQNHFYHQAKALSENDPQGFWANQFENTANFKIHHLSTGPEIWNQTHGEITDFCCAVGSGGTIAGVSRSLKEKNSKIKITLVDPFGSGLYSHIKTGKIASTGNSITEGIGIMRLTANFLEARIDDAIQVSDQDMINMLYYLARHEGLLVGTSAALNVFAAFQLAKQYKSEGLKNKVIVTILCDSALRYQSKLFNPDWLKEKKLIPKPEEIK